MTTPPPGEAGWMQRLENLARAEEWAAVVREGIAQETGGHGRAIGVDQRLVICTCGWQDESDDNLTQPVRPWSLHVADALIDGPLAPLLEALPKVEQARARLAVLLTRDRASLDLGAIWWELAQLRAAVCGVVDVNMPVQPLSDRVSDEQARTGVRGSGRCGATEGDDE